MADRVSQVVVESAELGTPKARASQVVAEVSAEGAPAARASQVVAEVSAEGTPSARASQVTAEVSAFGSPKARVSQIVIEFLVQNLQVAMLPIYPTLKGKGFSTHWRTKFANIGETAASLADIDLAIAQDPIHFFDLTYNFLRDGFFWPKGPEEFKRMKGFSLRIGGSAGRFLFKNPDDNVVTNQFIATTDGTTNIWTLSRTFGLGEDSRTEPVGYVDAALPFAAYLNGVGQDHTLWQLIQTTAGQQQIKFFNTPSAGQKLTVDMNYFYYCKFDADEDDFEKFVAGNWRIGKITLKSCKAGT